MDDMRDKIHAIAENSGHGAIAIAARKLGVSARTLHRALKDGPSEKLAEAIEMEIMYQVNGGREAFEASAKAHQQRRISRQADHLEVFMNRQLEKMGRVPDGYDIGVHVGVMVTLIEAARSGDAGRYIVETLNKTLSNDPEFRASSI